MKKVFILGIALSAWLSGKSQNKLPQTGSSILIVKDAPSDPTLAKISLCHEDAAEIIGLPVYLKDSVTVTEGPTRKHTCTYIATYEDNATKQTPSVFFAKEFYKAEDQSLKTYSFIKRTNAANPKNVVTDLSELGDEAFTIKDELNFKTIIVRKGTKLLKFRLYHRTDADSFNKLLKVAKKITAHV